MNDKTPVRRSHLDYSVRIPAQRGRAMIDQTQWCSAQFGPRWEAIGGQTGTWCVCSGPAETTPATTPGVLLMSRIWYYFY